MKAVLIKLAYLINKKYNTIEIKEDSYIKFRGKHFAITSLSLDCAIGEFDSLKIEALRGSCGKYD